MSVGGVWFAVDAAGVVGRFETERVSDDSVPMLETVFLIYDDDRSEPTEPAGRWARFEDEGGGHYGLISDGAATLDDLPRKLARKIAVVRFDLNFADVEALSLGDLPGARLAQVRSVVSGLGEWCLKRLEWLSVHPGQIRGSEEAFVHALTAAYMGLPPAQQTVLRHRFATDSMKSLGPAAAELGIDVPAATALWADALHELKRAARAHLSQK